MFLTLLGTGCPQVDTRRFGPSQIVRHDGGTYLVDCGSGTTQRLYGAGSNGAALDAVFLTHLHSDHIVDLFQLIISSWHQGRDRPQYIYGPKGTKRYVEGLLKLWKPEFSQRIAHEMRSTTAALGAEVVEIEAGEVFRAGDMVVTAIAVDHYPVSPAFGYLFETSTARLAISGDTTYCPALIKAAKGVDVLVHEVYIHDGTPQRMLLRENQGSINVMSYHTSSDVVGKVARETEAGILVLSHFVPTRFDEEELLQQVSADYDGPILVGEDLMTVDVEQRRVLSDGVALALGKQPAPKRKKPKPLVHPTAAAQQEAAADAQAAARLEAASWLESATMANVPVKSKAPAKRKVSAKRKTSAKPAIKPVAKSRAKPRVKPVAKKKASRAKPS